MIELMCCNKDGFTGTKLCGYVWEREKGMDGFKQVRLWKY